MLKLIEKIAELEHKQWSHWTTYFLKNLDEKNIERWKRQASTDYCNLTEEEKEKDRKWARKAIKSIIRELLLTAEVKKDLLNRIEESESGN